MQKRTLKELIDAIDSAWPLVQEWVTKARNNVELLPANRGRGEEVLLHLQITTRSPLGSVALESGGILIDHGWLRFLGSGNEQMQGNLLFWNAKGEILKDQPLTGAFIVAHDVLGGFFALNGGAFPGALGSTFYFAPDRLKWESTKLSYSQLLQWALNGDLDIFYKGMRWSGWKDEVSRMSCDQGFSIIPFLWTGPKPPIAERSRRAVPMTELWGLQQELARQIGDARPGTPIKIHFT